MSAGVIFALIAALLTAVSHVIAKDSLSRQSLPAFIIVRMGASFLATGLIVAWDGNLAELTGLDAKTWWILALTALLCPLMVHITFFSAIQRMPVNVAVPVYQSYPALSFVLGLIFLAEKFSLLTAAGILAVLAGVVSFGVTRKNGDGSKRIDPWGIALTLAGAFFMAVTAVIWKAVVSNASGLAICLIGSGISSLLLVAVYAPRLHRLQWGGWNTVFRTSVSGILVYVFANLLSIRALHDLSAGVVFSIVTTSVLWTGGIAYLTLKERWNVGQACAAASVVAGVVLVSL